MVTLSQLEAAEKLGFEMIGETFKDTLAYVQIQRKKKEIAHIRSSASTVKNDE